MFYWVIKWIAWPLRALYFRIETEGLDNLPRSGPVILVANHSSYLDAGILGSVMPRKVHFIVLSRMFRLWRIRWFYVGMETIPVHPGKPDHAAIRRALGILKGGGVVGIFPEGTRSVDGRLKPPQPGVAMIAIKAGAPVVPVAIHGAYQAYPPGSRWPRPSKIRVRFGEPFQPPARGGGRLSRDALEQFSQRIMQEIAALLPDDGSGARDRRAAEEGR